jgi:flavin reductase (DIM6/NTAB) family NADH-FMN oxidoreductase RutF
MAGQHVDDVNWIELSEPKQFSRLLYTNPVCFLCTTYVKEPSEKSDVEDAKGQAATYDSSSLIGAAAQNVMVLSWLTATNNLNAFMFSLCKRRYTASIISDGSIFTLSVPVQGMEELVRQVGSFSGRFGSKFAEDNHTSKTTPIDDYSTKEASSAVDGQDDNTPLSKRQRKKLQRELNQRGGIPELNRTDLHDSLIRDNDNGDTACPLFAVQGTVAHMVCRVTRIIPNTIDDEHVLVLAKVEGAHIQSAYWNAEKCLFRPAGSNVPPYLTFFGSQTFGYVVGEKKPGPT